ncbi:carboxypeptidase-like regulatory domain-containing protein [Lacrimispora amygdalina]|uniref:carboxypeptidase-like regulatory domain-containing protein n=1 Tax=Lacrimispora amygdalina TaxID=253257 RepID=UPI00140B5A43|nr:carboxypeptidase-like regulatory domain-containing protein [Lacrimispora amygdalina]
MSTACLTVFAAEIAKDEIYPPFSINKVQQQIKEIKVENDIKFSDSNVEKSIIQDSKLLSGIQSQENQSPIAELKMVVLNPESMINGKLTTQTQIAWLWSYNGQNFTYDPDGDSIADMQVGGISNTDIIGTVTGNIGFATQFKTAAQYQLTFQVQDSKGAWSNIAKYVFSIEPADGNTRPIGKINYSTNKLIPNQLLMISWDGSSDSDSGDQIASIGGMVVKDGVTTSLVDYVKQLNQTNCVLSFNEIGNYVIWFRVSDTHNAWSDWTIFTVEVESSSMANIQIKGITEPSSQSAWWVDNFQARGVSIDASQTGADYLFEHFGSHKFPASLPDKIVSDGNFEVTGRLLTASGKPIANTSVKITMRLTAGRGINQTVLSDKDGYFSYKPTLLKFWTDAGYVSDGNLNYEYLGDYSGQETQYIRFSSSGTNYLYSTVINVTAGGSTYSEEVTCLAGYTKIPMVGNLMYVEGEWYYR